MIHSAPAGSWKGSKRPPTLAGGRDKAQEVREREGLRQSLPENKARLWETAEVHRAGRMPGSLA